MLLGAGKARKRSQKCFCGRKTCKNAFASETNGKIEFIAPDLKTKIMKFIPYSSRAAACFLATSLLGGAIPARAQNDLPTQKLAMTRMIQSLGRVVTKAKKVTGNRQLKYGFYAEGCVFGASLRPNASASETFALKAGQSYVFIGGGDDTARNVDVLLQDARGRVVAKDTLADASPFVQFVPKASGRYKMSLKLRSARSSAAFCSVTVLQRNGYDLPVPRLGEALAKTLVLSAAVFQDSKGGRFIQDRNTWALYGGVVRSGNSLSSDPKMYGAANRGFVAVGDNRMKDLDLHLLSGSGKVLASDTGNGQAAAISRVSNRGTYSLGIVNKYSTGPALVMAVLMDLPANYRPTQAAPRPNNGGNQNVRSVFGSNWSGDWQDSTNDQSGTVELKIARNGQLRGSLYNEGFNVTVPITGSLKPNGEIAFTYSYANQPHIAKGRLSRNANGNLSGRVGFSLNNRTFFGYSNFVLSPDEGG